jgi:hypothetical protein
MISCTIKNRRIRLLVMEMINLNSPVLGIVVAILLRSTFLFLLLADMADNFYRQIN